MLKVSVIVPVFNAEKYLYRCIKSLINQTLNECEFIFIDDGSTDNSLSILKEYKSLDARIKVISQENCGVSKARNIGIENSSGEYLGFVDADDWVEPEMFELLYGASQKHNCDMAFCNYKYKLNGINGMIKYPFDKDIELDRNYIIQKLIPYIIINGTFNTVCTKLFKRSVVKKENILFPENVILGEDMAFNVDFIINNNLESNDISLIYIDYDGYNYDENFNSATHNKSPIYYFENLICFLNSKIYNKFEKVISKDKIENFKAVKLINETISILHIIVYQNEEKFWNKINQIKKIFSNKLLKLVLKKYYKNFIKSHNTYKKVLIYLIRFNMPIVCYVLINYIKIKSNLYGKRFK